MNEDEAWRAIDAHRERLCDLLDGLSGDEWRHPSLCAGWTVRDVAAHLTFAQGRIHQLLPELLRARGSLARMSRDSAIRRAARPTEWIVAEIRGMVGSRRHVQGVTHRETLIDILVHSQDISLPIGRPLDLPPDAAAYAADRLWRPGYRTWPRSRFAGVRLAATDAPWSAGEGAVVHAPIAAILLLLTGRTEAALPDLSGPGAKRLTPTP
ncbi:maleylpyruvate isomerase family mycothiol-dependent enzyme [Phytohabitans suffuscus]|uniref:Mycothiol-dependent maleylpyruvate isomerase metal-binding domain-containing protein n=1 Tax=Phytohabitans suffuscus TaxID=624315 RepID=A0A6F8YWB4_9ACTN|nr:maleylpyruvate isomerase family mycothiol-dependent enzyme [Phytohabitans suffuscus]BCB90465.1 hypothetical protein Psuf_077780 [Phytohabitans suffuscus]